MANGKMVPGLILAAGGVVRQQDQVLVILNQKRKEWTLPRGKLKPGESPERAALREVKEETGYPVRLGAYLGAISYLVNGLPKVVLYWEMTVAGQQGRIDASEVAEVRWLPLVEARQILTHELERGLLASIRLPDSP